MPKIVPKIVQTSFEHVLVQFFRIFFAQCSMEGPVFESFQKYQLFFKNPKMPKIVPNSVQTCFEHVLGQFFRKKNLPSAPWRVVSSKVFTKIIFENSKECPKSFPKLFKRALNMFWGSFSEIFFAQCFMEGQVCENFQKNQKFFRIPKMPEIVPKSVQTFFEHVLGQFFRIFSAQCSTEGQVCEKFQKNQKIFKITKMPKIVPKSAQTCF